MTTAQPSAMPAGPSLTGRFAAAIALTIGFYVLAIAIAGACLAVAILPWVFNGSNNLWLTCIGGFLGLSVLSALAPRRLRFEPSGVRVTASAQPRLHALIGEQVEAAGGRPPDEVYATLEVNAAVTEAGGRRIMVVGLPLLHQLSERELRSVIAHELGHYAGGDTKLGPWIHRTRAAIGRTIQRLSKEDDSMWSRRLVRRPFIWYGNGFLRITNAISRREEFAADARAALAAGRDVHVSALRKLHADGAAFDGYWLNEVVPVLDARRRPPIAEGFHRFIGAEEIRKAADELLERELAEGETSPYDSHPSLPERIAAVQPLPAGAPDRSPPAIALIENPDGLEAAVLDSVLGEDAHRFEPIAWDEVGAGVYLRRAHAMVAEYPEFVPDVTLGALTAAVEAIASTVEDHRAPGDDPGQVAELAAAVLANAVLAALDRAGWAIAALPAEPISARRGDDILIPHALVHALRARETTSAEWRALATRLGIADVPLQAKATAAVG
jgi:heat shock protein HtpX